MVPITLKRIPQAVVRSVLIKWRLNFIISWLIRKSWSWSTQVNIISTLSCLPGHLTPKEDNGCCSRIFPMSFPPPESYSLLCIPLAHLLNSWKKSIETNACSMTGPNELRRGLCGYCSVFNTSFEGTVMVKRHKPWAYHNNNSDGTMNIISWTDVTGWGVMVCGL